MRARRVLVAALAAGLVVVGGQAALAATASGADTRTAGDGIVALQSEVLALVELHAWPAPVPQRLQDVHDEYASYVKGLNRAALVDWALTADRDGERVLARMRAAGDLPTGAEKVALGPLTPAAKAALRGGGPLPLSPEAYVRALDDLEARSAGDVPQDAGAPSVPGPDAGGATAAASSRASAAPMVTATTTPAPSASSDASSAAGLSTERLFLAVGGAAAAVVGAVVVALVLRRRRRRAPVMSARQVVGLLDAGRLLSDAGGAAEVAAVAAAELGRLLRVGGSLLVATDGGREPSWTVLADPHGVLVPGAAAGGGILARVAATGQGTVQVVDDDPALGACAVLAVPVLVSGAVCAVLAAVRPAAQPFVVGDLRVAAELAPLLASALQGAAALEDVRAQAGRDALTGLPNRRSLDADLLAEIARNEGRTTAVVMVDVDNFKAFNDREGHAGGDLALRAVADALADSLRAQDGAYRYGGEEFCLLLRQVTADEAAALLDGVHGAVRALDVPGARRQPLGHLSVSAGVALLGDEEPAEAVRRADEALYRAKEQGRDRYVVAGHQAVPVPRSTSPSSPSSSATPSPRRGVDDVATSR